LLSEKYKFDDDNDDFISKVKELNRLNCEDENLNQQPALIEKTRDKVYCQLNQLESSFNPEASRIIENMEQGRKILWDQVNFAVLSASPSEVETAIFEVVWNHPNPKNRELWRPAINKELGEMDNKNFWEIIKNEDDTEGRRTIRCEWIFEIKRNGVF